MAAKLAKRSIFGQTPPYSQTWQCAKPWPEDCFVQCGGDGIVFVRKGNQSSYRTAFFEAFPKTPAKVDTFIRGEGKTIKEAEEDCWKQYQKHLACSSNHDDPADFDPKGYTNGYAFCKQCGMGRTIMPPPNNCCKCGKPTYAHDIGDNRMMCHQHYEEATDEELGEAAAKQRKERRETVEYLRSQGYTKLQINGNEDPDDPTLKHRRKPDAEARAPAG